MRWSLVVAVIALGVAAGCSSSSSSSPSSPSSSAAAPPSTAGAVAAAVSTSASASASPGSEEGGGCSEDAAAAVSRALASYDQVTSVATIGGCTQVGIETSLRPGGALSQSAATAVRMCEAAAQVAYTGSISSVTVDGRDRHELAVGLQGQSCISG